MEFLGEDLLFRKIILAQSREWLGVIYTKCYMNMKEEKIIPVGKGLRKETFELNFLKNCVIIYWLSFNCESNKLIIKNFSNIEKSLKENKKIT